MSAEMETRIKEEDVERAIEAALASPVDYEYAIDKEVIFFLNKQSDIFLRVKYFGGVKLCAIKLRRARLRKYQHLRWWRSSPWKTSPTVKIITFLISDEMKLRL